MQVQSINDKVLKTIQHNLLFNIENKTKSNSELRYQSSKVNKGPSRKNRKSQTKLN